LVPQPNYLNLLSEWIGVLSLGFPDSGVEVVATQNGFCRSEIGGWASASYLEPAIASAPDGEGDRVQGATAGQSAKSRETRRAHQENSEVLISDHQRGHLISFSSYKSLDEARRYIWPNRGKELAINEC
jgi:hypothetical protein